MVKRNTQIGLGKSELLNILRNDAKNIPLVKFYFLPDLFAFGFTKTIRLAVMWPSYFLS